MTAAPTPTARGAASEFSGARSGIDIAAHMPTSAPKLIDRTAALAPWTLPPAMKWAPQAMNDIQTCRCKVAGMKPNSQVSITASTKMVRVSAASLDMGFLPRG